MKCSHFYKCWLNALIVLHLTFIDLLCVFHDFNCFIWNLFQFFKVSLLIPKCVSSDNSATILSLKIIYWIITAAGLVSAAFMAFFFSGFHGRLLIRLEWACFEVKNYTVCLSEERSACRWAWEGMRLQCLKWLSIKISEKSQVMKL